MNLRRIGVVVLKILTCVALGGMVPAVIAYILMDSNYVVAVAGLGVYVGLFVGIVWSIQPKEVRLDFVVPIIWGVSFFLGGVLLLIITIPYEQGSWPRPINNMWGRLLHMEIVLSIPVGLLVGILRALARARGQTIKQFLSGVFGD